MLLGGPWDLLFQERQAADAVVEGVDDEDIPVCVHGQALWIDVGARRRTGFRIPLKRAERSRDPLNDALPYYEDHLVAEIGDVHGAGVVHRNSRWITERCFCR